MKFSFYSFILISFLFIPSLVSLAALKYVPLQPVTIPGGKDIYGPDILQFLVNLYTFTIALAGALAVIKIVYAGIKYMLSDAFTDKGKAKDEIWASVIGLIVILGSYTLLETINPAFVKFKLDLGTTTQMSGDGRELILNSYDKPLDTNGDGILSKEEVLAGMKKDPVLGSFVKDGSTTGEAILAAAKYVKDNPIENTQCSNTDNGRKACAYAVNQVVGMATGAPIDSGLSVAGLKDTLSSSARFTYVGNDLSQMQAGDVIITQDKGSHTGIADKNGTIISNSSNASEASNGQIILRSSDIKSWENYFGESQIFRPKQ